MKSLSIKTVGLALGALVAATYVLCVLWDLVFPGWAMYQVWQGLFPGFSWSIGGLVIGLVEAIIYGFYPAVIFVPVYNYLQRRDTETAAPATEKGTPMPEAHH